MTAKNAVFLELSTFAHAFRSLFASKWKWECFEISNEIQNAKILSDWLLGINPIVPFKMNDMLCKNSHIKHPLFSVLYRNMRINNRDVLQKVLSGGDAETIFI